MKTTKLMNGKQLFSKMENDFLDALRSRKRKSTTVTKRNGNIKITTIFKEKIFNREDVMQEIRVLNKDLKFINVLADCLRYSVKDKLVIRCTQIEEKIGNDIILTLTIYNNNRTLAYAKYKIHDDNNIEYISIADMWYDFNNVLRIRKGGK